MNVLICNADFSRVRFSLVEVLSERIELQKTIDRSTEVPFSSTSERHLRRARFNGLSHSYCATRAAEMIARQNIDLIVAHLGNGASISAIRNGVCMDTSMGFNPLEGLKMRTRSGSIDPGMLIYLRRHTAGVREHAPMIRQRVCDNFCHLDSKSSRTQTQRANPMRISQHENRRAEYS